MTDFQKSKEIIKLFIKDAATINWPQEIRVCKKLLQFNSDLEFWKKITLGFKLNSTAWFLTAEGKKFLEKSREEFEKDFSVLHTTLQANLSKDEIVKDNKLVEETPVVAPKQTLLSWLSSSK